MSTLTVPNIGPVDFTNDDNGYWRVETNLGDSEVAITFDTDGSDMTAAMLARVNAFIADIAGFDKNARQAISSNFTESDESSSRIYLTHHVEELGAEERAECFGTTDTTLGIDHLLSSLSLKRIGLYPNGDAKVAVFDYSIGADITDYILAVEFSPEGKVLDVSMES